MTEAQLSLLLELARLQIADLRSAGFKSTADILSKLADRVEAEEGDNAP